MSDRYRVVGVMEGDRCPAEEFLATGEKATESSRLGLIQMLQFVAKNGLHGSPSAWFHEASKSLGIYEFKKGDLRLFFFKGENGDIAVCTCGVLKRGQKADKTAVTRASEWRAAYQKAIKDQTYEVVWDEDQ